MFSLSKWCALIGLCLLCDQQGQAQPVECGGDYVCTTLRQDRPHTLSNRLFLHTWQALPLTHAVQPYPST